MTLLTRDQMERIGELTRERDELRDALVGVRPFVSLDNDEQHRAGEYEAAVVAVRVALNKGAEADEV